MKMIEPTGFLAWLREQQSLLAKDRDLLGTLFWTGADVTCQKIIDHITDSCDEAD